MKKVKLKQEVIPLHRDTVERLYGISKTVKELKNLLDDQVRDFVNIKLTYLEALGESPNDWDFSKDLTQLLPKKKEE